MTDHTPRIAAVAPPPQDWVNSINRRPKPRRDRVDWEQRTLNAEARIVDAETRAADAEARAEGAETSAADADERATEARTRATDAETRATDAETRATDAETRATDAETRATDAETRATDAETRVDGGHRRITTLLQALDSRGPIDQAKGILMSAFGLDADAAFDTLVWVSQSSNVKLVQVVDRFLFEIRVVDTGDRTREQLTSLLAAIGRPNGEHFR